MALPCSSFIAALQEQLLIHAMKKSLSSYQPKGKGVTLIELTIVVSVILVLISVLFVGAEYYRNNSSKSACVINQSAIERAAQVMKNINGARPEDFAATYAEGAPLADKVPICPTAGTYTVSVLEAAKCDVTDPIVHDAGY